MEKGIFKLTFDCGRSGELYGIFISEKSKVKELVESGEEVYFGEVLGKHSEVCGPIDESEIELVTDDLHVIEIFEKYDLSSGYNPFDYLD